MSDQLKVWDCASHHMNTDREAELLSDPDRVIKTIWTESSDLKSQLQNLEQKCLEHSRCPCTVCKRILTETVSEAQQLIKQNEQQEGQSMQMFIDPPGVSTSEQGPEEYTCQITAAAFEP